MRTVVKTYEVPHLWAHQTQSNARNPQGNLYFRDSMIFSYRDSFPIACIYTHPRRGKLFLFNSDRYSSTTNSHQSACRQAVPPGETKVEVPWCLGRYGGMTPPHDDNLKWFEKEIIAKSQKAKRARINGPWLLRQLEAFVKGANDYCVFFGLRRRFEVPTNETVAAILAKWERRDKRAEAIAKKKAEAAAAEAEKEFQKNLKKWKAGKAGRLYGGDGRRHYLRVRGSRLETSLGVVIEIKQALPILKMIRDGKTYNDDELRVAQSVGMPANPNPVMVGEYRLDEITADGTVKIGCHEILKEEIERIAKQLKL